MAEFSEIILMNKNMKGEIYNFKDILLLMILKHHFHHNYFIILPFYYICLTF